MKKSLLMVLLLAVISLAGITNVYAMTEDELRAKGNQTFDINGTPADIPASYIKLFNDYLDTFEVSEADCEYIAGQIDYLYGVAVAKNITNVVDLRKKAYAEVREVAANVTANTKATVTVNGNGVVTVSRYDDPSKVFAKIEGNTVAKNTGSVNLLYVAGIITLLGAGLLVYRVKKA